MANLFPVIVPGTTLGSDAAVFINAAGQETEISFKTVTAIANVATELNYFRTNDIVYSIAEKQYYKYNGTSWVIVSDIMTSINTYTKTQTDGLVNTVQGNLDTVNSVLSGNITTVQGNLDTHTGLSAKSSTVHGLKTVSSELVYSDNTKIFVDGAKQLKLDTTGASPSVIGQMTWDANYLTPQIKLDSNVTLQIGQESLVYCYNNTGSTISNGAVVYLSGGEPTKETPTIDLADASTYSKASKVIGITTESILDGNYGFVTQRGLVHDIDTHLWTAGTFLYLSTTPGGLSATPPSKANGGTAVNCALVVKQHGTAGVILANIHVGIDISDIGGVSIVNPVTGQLLIYNSVTDLWVNADPTTLPYLPITGGNLTGTENITPSTNVVPLVLQQSVGGTSDLLDINLSNGTKQTFIDNTGQLQVLTQTNNTNPGISFWGTTDVTTNYYKLGLGVANYLSTPTIRLYGKKAGSVSSLNLRIGGEPIGTKLNRIDVDASEIHLTGDDNYIDGNLDFSKTSTASSAGTQASSHVERFISSLWTGTTEFPAIMQIYYNATTTQGLGRFTLTLQDVNNITREVLSILNTNGNVGINDTNSNAKLSVVGSIDEVQLKVKSNATQTSNIEEIQDSNGVVLSRVSGTGQFLSSGIMQPIVTKTANYQVTTNDHTILINGDYTVTLPTAANSYDSTTKTGLILHIKNIRGVNNVKPSGSEKIDTSTIITLNSVGDSLTIQSDGTQWWIL